MNQRTLYVLLFGVPGFFLAILAALICFATAAGALWLFVFGDNPWPAATQTVLPAAGAAIFLVLWAGIIACGYRYGQRREDGSPLDRRHLALAAAATALPIVLIVLHLYRVGHLGPKSDALLCSDYCRERGYAGSGMPPRDSGERNCICYDGRGGEALVIPLDRLTARP